MKAASYLVPLMLSLSLSCSRPANKAAPDSRIEQRVLFGHSFVNYAWGYQNRGWFIDNEGLMKAYRVVQADMWHRPETAGPDSGYIFKEALETNHGLANWVIYRVPMGEVYDKCLRIPLIKDGPYSERTHSAYDAGSVEFYAYYFDQKRGAYLPVLVSQSGDFSKHNEDPDAIEIEKWLKELNRIYAESLATQR
jgi:hypothetical protein